MLQRLLPVFRHLTCSGAVSHTQLWLFHPLMTHPHKTIHSDANCLKRVVSKKGQTGPFGGGRPQPGTLPHRPCRRLPPAAPGIRDAASSLPLGQVFPSKPFLVCQTLKIETSGAMQPPNPSLSGVCYMVGPRRPAARGCSQTPPVGTK